MSMGQLEEYEAPQGKQIYKIYSYSVYNNINRLFFYVYLTLDGI